MRVLLVSCGGTIVSPDASTDVAAERAMDNAAQMLVNSLRTQRFHEALLSRAEHIGNPKHRGSLIPELVGMDLLDKDSTEVGPEDWCRIIGCIVNNYDNYDAFIIAHGTNSLAYTASAVAFGLPLLSKPVIITGSNTPIGVPYSDALFNAANAVLLVQRMVANANSGVVVVFASRIIPGVRAKKANGTELEAFRTFNASDIGQMRPKEIIFNDFEYCKYRPALIDGSPWQGQEPAKTAKALVASPRADYSAIISSHTFHPGDDPRTYNAVIDAICSLQETTSLRGALIIRAVGDGDTSKVMHEYVFKKAETKKIPVVVTTQEPQGTSSFRGNAQSKDVSSLHLIPAWDMSIETMVVKLRYLLSTGLPYDKVQSEFTRNYLGEINTRR